MASVTLEKVAKTYVSKTEEVQAVRDLDLEIRDGEFMCLLGPSGCGKTSTLRMIVGLEDISDGTIKIGDRVVNDLDPQSRNVAMSFETYALYTHLSVKENILFPLRARGSSKEEMQRRLTQVADMLDIRDILNRSPTALSGGQQQRISLARALIREPDVFLLDEPLEHLDITLRVATRARIKRLHSELDTTMIYVTHDQLEAISLADRIAVMNFAELQQVGTREELLNRPKNLFVADFIGEPAINFIDAELESENGTLFAKFKSGSSRLEIPKKWADKLKKEELKEVKLGIRPHDMVPESRPGYVGMEGVVDIFEFLGEENHVTCVVGEESVTMVVDFTTFFEQGDKISLNLPPERLHVFDPRTEECLTTRYKAESAE